MIPSPTELLIIMVIVLLIFGSKRIANLGKDLGTAFQGFRSGLSEAEETKRDIDRLTD